MVWIPGTAWDNDPLIEERTVREVMEEEGAGKVINTR
jgi:hypothetical protein